MTTIATKDLKMAHRLISHSIQCRSVGGVKYLLCQGICPMEYAVEHNVQSPLELAIEVECLDIVRVLVEFGAYTSLDRLQLNRTALFYAVMTRQLDMIKELLDYDVEWEGADEGDHSTVLHMAVEYGTINYRPPLPSENNDHHTKVIQIIKILEIFLDRGAPINAKTTRGETPLMLAVKRDLKKAAACLIFRGADPKLGNNRDESLVHILIKNAAVLDGKIKKQLLSDDDPSVSEVDRLMSREPSVEESNAEFIEWLVAQGVNPNTANDKGKLPLNKAIKHEFRNIIQVLLKSVDVTYIDHEGKTWLHVFLELYYDYDEHWSGYSTNELDQIVEFLLKRGSVVNVVDRLGKTPFYLAAVMKNVPIMNMMLESFTHVNAIVRPSGDTVLHALARSCSDVSTRQMLPCVEIVDTLLQKGANIHRANSEGITPFQLAKREMFQLFCEFSGHNEHPNCREYISSKPLRQSELTILGNGALTTLEQDIKRGLRLNLCEGQFNFTALHLAVENSDIKAVEMLLNYGADVNARGVNGLTPLHLAVAKDNLLIVKLLAEYRADLNCLDECLHQLAPLHHAAIMVKENMAELLIRCGADLNVTDEDGMSPLHWACTSMKDRFDAINNAYDQIDFMHKYACWLLSPVKTTDVIDMIELFVKFEADVDARQAAGDTPLHMVVKQSKPNPMVKNIFETLLVLGADPNIEDYDGCIPLYYAIVYNCNVGVKLFLDFLSDIDHPRVRQVMIENLVRKDLEEIVVLHMIRLDVFENKLSSFYKNELNARWDIHWPRNQAYRQECEKEKEKLKNHKIDDKVSLFELAHSGSHRQYKFLQIQTFNFNEIIMDYPIYGAFIWIMQCRANERTDLLRRAHMAHRHVFHVALPEKCTSYIFRLLDGSDLKNIIEVSQTYKED